jgi:general secretion pathway protein G
LLEEKRFMMICNHDVKRRSSRRKAGFTLIEILLVIVILLLLASALVVFLLPQQEGAEKNTTRLLLNQVATALDTYRLNIGRYPTEQDGGLNALTTKPNYENQRLGEKWQGPYLKPGTRLEDPWGHAIRYEVVDKATTSTEETKSGPPYKLYSIGPDGQPDTEDDIKLMPEQGDKATDATTGTEQP